LKERKVGKRKEFLPRKLTRGMGRGCRRERNNKRKK